MRIWPKHWPAVANRWTVQCFIPPGSCGTNSEIPEWWNGCLVWAVSDLKTRFGVHSTRWVSSKCATTLTSRTVMCLIECATHDPLQTHLFINAELQSISNPSTGGAMTSGRDCGLYPSVTRFWLLSWFSNAPSHSHHSKKGSSSCGNYTDREEEGYKPTVVLRTSVFLHPQN